MQGFGAAGGGAQHEEKIGGQRQRLHPARRRPITRSNPRLGGADHGIAQGLRGVTQPIGDAQRRLGDDLDGAQLQRPDRRVGTLLGQGRDHDHRHGVQPHQMVEKGQAVHARHLDIQGNHIGLQLLDQRAGLIRIVGGAHHLYAPVSAQQFGEQLADHRRVVDHQYARDHQNSSTVPLDTGAATSWVR